MADNFIVRCPHCGARNRIPRQRWGDRTSCGRCKQAIPITGSFPGHTIYVHDWSFKDEVIDFPGPVLVEFYSPS